MYVAVHYLVIVACWNVCSIVIYFYSYEISWRLAVAALEGI